MKLKIALSIVTLTAMAILSGGLSVASAQAHKGSQSHHHGPPAYRHGAPHYRHRPVYHRHAPTYRFWHWGPPGRYPYVTDKAFKYMGITAFALGFLDLLNADQQRSHEMALINAASRPGEEIIWESGDARGTVQVTRTGATPSGRQCREFQQTVTVGGRTEQAYGTACLQPDGSWEILGTH